MHSRLNTRFILLIAIDQIFYFGRRKIRNFSADEENTHELFAVLITKLDTLLFKITDIWHGTSSVFVKQPSNVSRAFFLSCMPGSRVVFDSKMEL